MASGVRSTCASNSRVNARVAVVVDARGGPGGEQLLTLRRRQQRQIGHPLLRPRDHTLEQHLEVRQQTSGCSDVEEVGVVFEAACEAAVALRHEQRQIVLGRLTHLRNAADLEPGQCEARARLILQREHHLKKRWIAQAPGWLQLFDDPFERQRLVRVGAEGRLFDAGQQFAESRVPRQIRAQRQRVDEEANQVFGLGPIAARDRRADDEVFLAAVAVQECLKRGEQGHEQRHALARAQLRDTATQSRRESGLDQSASHGLQRRPRPRHRQIDHRGRPRELLPPVVHLLVEHGALQPAALPPCEIGILNRQIGQRRRSPSDDGLVDRRNLTQQDPHRPAVADDMVHVEQQHVVLRGETQQADAQQGCAAQIKRLLRVRQRQPGRFRLARGLRPGLEVHDGQIDFQTRRHDQHRLTADQLEAAAHHFVTRDDGRERLPQRGDVEVPAQPQRTWDVVRGTVGLELTEKPQPLLGERHRRRPSARRLGAQHGRQLRPFLLRARCQSL